MQQVIVKVMQQEAKNKPKFNKAKTFCFNRLTDLRCEERRRVSLGFRHVSVYFQNVYLLSFSFLASNHVRCIRN